MQPELQSFPQNTIIYQDQVQIYFQDTLNGRHTHKNVKSQSFQERKSGKKIAGLDKRPKRIHSALDADTSVNKRRFDALLPPADIREIQQWEDLTIDVVDATIKLGEYLAIS
jgi:hypothetical protein